MEKRTSYPDGVTLPSNWPIMVLIVYCFQDQIKPSCVKATGSNMDNATTANAANVEKTIGEQRVRTSFNVAGAGIVDDIKRKSAELIDLCEGLKQKDPRLASLAQTTYEEAAMWAVKAATA